MSFFDKINKLLTSKDESPLNKEDTWECENCGKEFKNEEKVIIHELDCFKIKDKILSKPWIYVQLKFNSTVLTRSLPKNKQTFGNAVQGMMPLITVVDGIDSYFKKELPMFGQGESYDEADKKNKKSAWCVYAPKKGALSPLEFFKLKENILGATVFTFSMNTGSASCPENAEENIAINFDISKSSVKVIQTLLDRTIIYNLEDRLKLEQKSKSLSEYIFVNTIEELLERFDFNKNQKEIIDKLLSKYK
jgi:uncharacterized protein (UPF0216 family)